MRSIVVAGILVLLVPIWWITVQVAYRQGKLDEQEVQVQQRFEEVRRSLTR